MPLLNNQITLMLESLCLATFSDFSSIAIIESNQQRASWRYAFGERSERSKQMTLKTGVGPAGLALRTGKTIIWNDRTSANWPLRDECPLMTAEKLHNAAAFPLIDQDRIKAVLLVARRTSSSFTDTEISGIQGTLQSLLPLIEY